jgi:hypothetical protein
MGCANLRHRNVAKDRIGVGLNGGGLHRAWDDLESVVVLDKLTYAGNPDNLSSVQNDARFKLVQGDIGDRTLVSDLLTKHGIRAVLNFAAESHVDRSIHAPGEFIQTNVVGTFELLEAVRAYWGAVGTPNPGERPAPGLTLPQLVEAVARVALNKWGPGTGMCLGWMVKLSEREKAAYMLHLGRAKGGPLAPALPFLDAALLPCCHRIFAEWALRRVCDVAGALGAQPSAEQVSATRENPLDAVAVAEAERAGGGLGTALLSALKRKGLPLPGRPDFPVGFSTLPQPVVTLAPENVLHKSEAWKRKEAMTTRIAPPSQ